MLATLAVCNIEDLSNFCIFLDLPQASIFGAIPFNEIKSVIGERLRNVAVEWMKDALEKERCVTLE